MTRRVGPIECPGEGRCHGPQKWCDHCGDVGAMCDADPTKPGEWCDAHICRECMKGPQKISDLLCESCTLHEEATEAEMSMLRAARRGDEVAAEAHGNRFKKLLNG